MFVRLRLSSTLSVALLALPLAVEGADDAADQSAKLEEIVVTAQKRSERLQDVPISAQVIGSARLQEQNFNDLQDLTQTVPSVHISSGHATNALFIRGVGSAENPTFDQSVATFVDDIYRGRSRLSAATFLDLDHIEVLKGPQSTFFGNNAIAGALNVVTRKPGHTFDASARALYGEFGQYALEGAVGGPVTDQFGARLAVTRNGDDRGWIETVNTGQHVPRVNNLAGRLTLAYKPVEELDATLKAEGSRHRTSGSYVDLPLQRTDCPPPAPLTATYPNPFYCAQALALGLPIGLNNNRNASLPGQFNELSTFENVLTLDYRKWDHVFTSVSGFYNYHFNFHGDLGQLPMVGFLTNENPEKYHQFSQELRLTSPTGRTFEYLAGLYFQTDHLETDGETNAPFLNFLPSFGAPFDQLTPYLPLAAQQIFLQDERVYSVFGSLSWNATNRIKLSAGLRGSWDKKDVNQSLHWGTSAQVYGGYMPTMPMTLQPLLSFVAGVPGDHSLNRSDQAWMPSARIQYQLKPQAMVYFSYSRGFKAGGVDFQELPSGGLSKYEPEYVNAYEVGIKSTWLDERALLNLDVFRSNYTDLQTLTERPNGAFGYFPVVTNVAASRSQGVEFEAQWAATRDFRISANATYLDSYYLSFPNAPPTTLRALAGAPFQDLSGYETPLAPRWSGSVTASYNLLLPNSYRFTTELSPYLTSSYYFVSGDPFFHVGGYVRLDGRLSLEGPNGRWSIDLIGKNLTDRTIVSTPSGLTFYLVSKEPPRNVALQFRYHF